MNGIAFSGGGLKGAYQVGAYKAFLDCNIKIDGFVGTSIGALNAAIIASGKYEELFDFWYNCNAGDILGLTKNLSKEINEAKLDKKLIKELFFNIKTIINNKGISTEGLREVLDKFKVNKYLYKSKKDFGLVTVRFKDFKPVIMFKENIKPDKLNDYLIASCLLPIFKLEKIIDDNYYLDGGFYDNAPANVLLDKGYDKVYVIDLQAIGLKRPYKDKQKLVIIKPSRSTKSILDIKKYDIRSNMELGYFDALKVLKKLDGNKYIFKVRSNFYYELLIKKVDDKTKKEMSLMFGTKNAKRLIIKAVELVMQKNKWSYFKVYNIKKVIKEIKKDKNDYGVYKFIKKLRVF